MKNTPRIAALLIAAALALTGCGDDADGTGATGSAAASDSSSSGTSAAFNDADVSFAQGMIPHHRQAVEMAQLAADRAENAEVKKLAAEIEAAQAPEIEQLTIWLEEWGEEAPSEGEMGGMDHGSMGDGDSSTGMSGMMTEEDMAMLEGASGAEFDQMFLEMMVKHHTSAIEMAEIEVAEGQHPDAKAMAEQIISTQQAEIERMQELLTS